MFFESQTAPPDTILLVDNSPANLADYRAALKDTGEHLILAKSAQTAMEQLLEFDVAVILLNVELRGSDGFELCQTIREHSRGRSTSILLVSDVPITDSDLRKGYQSGATDYITLPVPPEVLRAKVTLLADRYRNARQVEKLTKTAQRKNHFLAAIAHELRNPLAPIASAAQVLRMKMAHDKDAEWVSEVIERQVVNLKKLVDDVLDIGRISQNQLVLQREKVQLASLLSAAAKEARPAIKKSGHELSLTVPKEPVYLFADSARLIQVFRTLLENSAKIPNSSRRIFVVAELEDAGVAVRISDPGAGDPALGIDLSLVWDLVEMHGGTVEVTSGSSQTSSEFIVHLPILVQSPVETDLSKSSEPAPSLRILIAEDNPDTAATLAVSLRLDGHSVEIAQDGLEALSIAETFRPQVALLDIGMPGMTGYEVARKIRSMAWGKETLLIAQTGWGRAKDWEKAVESGFNFHLTKPLNYDALTKILDNFRNHLSGNLTPDNKSTAA